MSKQTKVRINSIKTYLSKPQNIILILTGILVTFTTIAPIVAIIQDTIKIHPGTIDQYLTGRTVLNCGDATAAEIDEEVMLMLKAAYAEAKRLLSENREAMDHIAEYLIEKETITGKEFMRIFRQVKGIPEPENTEAEAEGAVEETVVETVEAAAETDETVQKEIVNEPFEAEAETEENKTEEQ